MIIWKDYKRHINHYKHNKYIQEGRGRQKERDGERAREIKLEKIGRDNT